MIAMTHSILPGLPGASPYVPAWHRMPPVDPVVHYPIRVRLTNRETGEVRWVDADDLIQPRRVCSNTLNLGVRRPRHR